MNDTACADTCADCGKSGIGLKNCTACKSVKYCNVDCQRNHRSSHKKECKRIKRELELFRTPPRPDCLICALPLPLDSEASTYQPCCGKMLCTGCSYENSFLITKENVIRDNRMQIEPGLVLPKMPDVCAFCRTVVPISGREFVDRLETRSELKDAHAMAMLGMAYCAGNFGIGINRDIKKGCALFHRAAELGSSMASFQLMLHYKWGTECCEKNPAKMLQYGELAATAGNIMARHELGIQASQLRDLHSSLRHLEISAKGGLERSLWFIRTVFLPTGFVTIEKFDEIEGSQKAAMESMRSDQRERARRSGYDIDAYCSAAIEENEKARVAAGNAR